jgi:hypothetical protein
MEAKRLIPLAVLLATACSGPTVREQSPATSTRQEGAAGESVEGGTATGTSTEVRLARLPDSRLGDAAAAEGVLRVEGTCLYLEAAGSIRYLIASTIPGARWDAAGEALVVPSEGGAEAATYSPGERVNLGGSEARAATLSGKWVEPPGAACDTSRIWVTNSILPASSD